jgi:hypothetical protein
MYFADSFLISIQKKLGCQINNAFLLEFIDNSQNGMYSKSTCKEA